MIKKLQMEKFPVKKKILEPEKNLEKFLSPKKIPEKFPSSKKSPQNKPEGFPRIEKLLKNSSAQKKILEKISEKFLRLKKKF